MCFTTPRGRHAAVQCRLADQCDGGGFGGGSVAGPGPLAGAVGPGDDILGLPVDEAEQDLAGRDAGAQVGGEGGELGVGGGGRAVDSVARFTASALVQGEVAQERILEGIGGTGFEGTGVETGLGDVRGGDHGFDGVEAQRPPGVVVGGEVGGQAQVAGRVAPVAAGAGGAAVVGERGGQVGVGAGGGGGQLPDGADLVVEGQQPVRRRGVEAFAPGRGQLGQQHRAVHGHGEIDGGGAGGGGDPEETRRDRRVEGIAAGTGGGTGTAGGPGACRRPRIDCGEFADQRHRGPAVEDGDGLCDVADVVGKRGQTPAQRRRPRRGQWNRRCRRAPVVGGGGVEDLVDAARPTAGDAAQGRRGGRVDGDADGVVDQVADLGHLQRGDGGDHVGDADELAEAGVGGAAGFVGRQDHRHAAVDQAFGNSRQLAQRGGVGVLGVVDDDDGRRTGKIDVRRQPCPQRGDGGRRRSAARPGFEQRRLRQGIRRRGAGFRRRMGQDAPGDVLFPRQRGHPDALETGEVGQHVVEHRRLARPRRARQDDQRPRAGRGGRDALDQRTRRGAADRVLDRRASGLHGAPMVRDAPPGPAHPNPVLILPRRRNGARRIRSDSHRGFGGRRGGPERPRSSVGAGMARAHHGTGAAPVGHRARISPGRRRRRGGRNR